MEVEFNAKKILIAVISLLFILDLFLDWSHLDMFTKLVIAVGNVYIGKDLAKPAKEIVEKAKNILKLKFFS